jgi:hypothetical protein
MCINNKNDLIDNLTRKYAEKNQILIDPKIHQKTDQIVDFLIVGEEGFRLPILVLDKGLDVQVEALAGRALVGLRGQLTLFEEQRQQRKQGMPETETG